jgi:HPt (histidine-containing phosphotransfer) domain-containing protein
MTINTEEKIMVHIDPELKDLIPEYLENRYKDIESITAALEQKDYGTVQTLGHSMKGSGGGYGFEGITEIGRALEQAAKCQNSEEIRKLTSELGTYLECVEVIYE